MRLDCDSSTEKVKKFVDWLNARCVWNSEPDWLVINTSVIKWIVGAELSVQAMWVTNIPGYVSIEHKADGQGPWSSYALIVQALHTLPEDERKKFWYKFL